MNNSDMTVIFLHGIGSSGVDFKPVLMDISNLYPNVQFILPTAPERVMSMTGRRTTAWYDIFGYDERSPEDDKGIKDAALLIYGLVDREMKRGQLSRRIVLAGMSQGGALALYSGLKCPFPLGGILVFGAYLPLAKTFKEERNIANDATSILMCHGKKDNVVEHKWARKTYELIKKYHSNIKLLSYTGILAFTSPIHAILFDRKLELGHEISDAQLSDANVWFQDIISKS